MNGVFSPTKQQPPWSEVDRLAALRSYSILDTEREADFDDFVQLAADICDAPIAVINLIDEGRQWFKAEIGLGVRQTPLDVSICSHAILQPDVFVVPDTTMDSRFDANPLVIGQPNLRFYGGALLETADGLPLGTLCVLDYTARPHGLSKRQQFSLRTLARQVMTQLELRRALQDRQRAELALMAALAEKDLLMQEVHHRVKNSLQMVQNLLTLQARAAPDPATGVLLRESSARVNTISAIHDRLYRDGSALEVEIGPYLRGLLDDLGRATGNDSSGRQVSLDADVAIWSAVDVPTLGLVLTELFTNALKYGEGAIRVEFRQIGEDSAELSVSDQGSNLPADFEPTDSRGLGMRIITGLLRASGGQLEVVRGRGHTCFRARLPGKVASSAVPVICSTTGASPTGLAAG